VCCYGWPEPKYTHKQKQARDIYVKEIKYFNFFYVKKTFT